MVVMVKPVGVSPEGSECLEVDGLQHVLGGVELQQEHDEDAVVRQLLELRLPHVVILDQHAHHNAQHLQTQHQESWQITAIKNLCCTLRLTNDVLVHMLLHKFSRIQQRNIMQKAISSVSPLLLDLT